MSVMLLTARVPVSTTIPMRPTLPADKRRDHILQIRLTAAEKARLTEQARRFNESMSRMIRRIILG